MYKSKLKYMLDSNFFKLSNLEDWGLTIGAVILMIVHCFLFIDAWDHSDYTSMLISFTFNCVLYWLLITDLSRKIKCI
jgi:hypothetical protein